MAGQGIYNVDIVMCIDATGSMKHILDEVKSNALSLYPKFAEAMETAEKEVAELRVKVIAFRDYGCDTQPMVQSEFFTLPEQADELNAFVNSLEAMGGGDAPENALEAISYALKSDWTTGGVRRRHVIAVFTDAPTLPLGARAGSAQYPVDLPKDLAELSAIWEGTDQTTLGNYQPKAGRLIAFVPEDESWKMLETWNRVVPAYTKAGIGCSDYDMEMILRTITGSV